MAYGERLMQKRKEEIVPKFRKMGNSKIYHIMIKGIDGQNIFYDDKDRRNFLRKFLENKKEFNYAVYSYCLMTNHVHMVIKCKDEFLSKSMQSLMIRYVRYFNKKYQRTGSLVQSRFKSKCIENQKYFLEVCRYIHRNPEKAGIKRTDKYVWSSYQEYINEAKIIDKDVLLHYYNNNILDFVKYTTQIEDIENYEDYAEYEIVGKLTDDQLKKIILEKFQIQKEEDIATFFKEMSKKELEKYIKSMKEIKGTYKTQISRVIRVNRRIVSNIWDK